MAYTATLREPPEEAERPDVGEEADDKASTMKMSDTDLLSILMAERQASIGFENAAELDKKRQQALEYSKGVMSDVPSLANRSKAVSTDVIDAIETVLPDILEIFTSGDDVVTFSPNGKDDEEGAKQETDYCNYVAFEKIEPTGWMLLYTAIKDALQLDTGIIRTWWQDNEVTEEETLRGITAIQLQTMQQEGTAKIESWTPAEPSPDGVELFDVKTTSTYDRGCIKCAAIDASNLSAGSDTTIADIANANYLVIRAFPRAQSLIDDGFEAEQVDKLQDYASKGNEQTDLARDLAAETVAVGAGGSGAGTISTNSATRSPMRIVEVHTHWIRIDGNEDGKSELWQVQTDSECKVVLDKREVDRIGIAVGTPFIQTHRFYGSSLADKLVEIQKIKTALLRMLLDSGYFAMNGRYEVAEEKSNKNTISDLMRNEPMVPVRSRTGDAVRAISPAALGFDVPLALEYVSTMGESRGGVVRNAQGLNPDTLHDTKGGALALMSMAQKRTRMIARVFAETLVKKWLLDIHWLSRKHNTRSEKIQLRGKWVDVDPSKFGDRTSMKIGVGVGSGGKEQDIAAYSMFASYIEKLLLSPNPDIAKIPSPKNVYDLTISGGDKLGVKNPERFLTDPTPPVGPDGQPIPQPPQPQAPDPAAMKAQADAQAAQQKAQQAQEAHTQAMQQAEQQHQMDIEMAQRQAQLEEQKAMAKAQTDAKVAEFNAQQKTQLARQQAADEAQLARDKAAQEADIARGKAQAEYALAQQRAAWEAELANKEMDQHHQRETTRIEKEAQLPKNRPGGALDE